MDTIIHLLPILRDAIAIICVVVGSVFLIAGAVGVIRMPDFYTRIHAAGMTDTLGAELIIIGLLIHCIPENYIWAVKLFFVGAFLAVTSPTATHAVANAAQKAGLKPKLGAYKAPSMDDEDEDGEAH